MMSILHFFSDKGLLLRKGQLWPCLGLLPRVHSGLCDSHTDLLLLPWDVAGAAGGGNLSMMCPGDCQCVGRLGRSASADTAHTLTDRFPQCHNITFIISQHKRICIVNASKTRECVHRTGKRPPCWSVLGQVIESVSAPRAKHEVTAETHCVNTKSTFVSFFKYTEM